MRGRESIKAKNSRAIVNSHYIITSIGAESLCYYLNTGEGYCIRYRTSTKCDLKLQLIHFYKFDFIFNKDGVT